MVYSDDQLQHWGIFGMKWGERRFRNRDGTLTEAGKARYGRSASAKTMSDEELRTSVNRMRTELEYTRLKREIGRNTPIAKTMSDEELRTSVNRMRTELEYTRLKREIGRNTPIGRTVSAGKAAARSILKGAGKVLSTVVNNTIVPFSNSFSRELGTAIGKNLTGNNGNNGNDGNNGGNKKGKKGK